MKNGFNSIEGYLNKFAAFGKKQTGYEIDFPNGVKARFINLKCCLPKGIPTIVMQSKIPKKRCVNAIQKPPHTIQIKFITVDKHPVFDEVSVIFTPNGARPTIANLKH